MTIPGRTPSSGRRGRLRPAWLLGCALAAWLAAGDALARLVVMHGPAELTSAVPWIQADAPGPVSVQWRAGADVAPRNSIEIVAGGSQFWNRGTRFEACDVKPLPPWRHEVRAADLAFPRAGAARAADGAAP